MSNSSTNNSGTIYFVEEQDQLGFTTAGYLKIGLINDNVHGRTSNDRKDEHQTGNPRPLIVVDSIDTTASVSTLESLIHQCLTMHRHRGEWFVKPNGDHKQFKEKSLELKKSLEELNSLERGLQEYTAIEDSGEEIKEDSVATDIHHELVETTSTIQHIDEQKKLVEYKLRSLGGERMSDITGICSYQLSKPIARFNKKEFQTDNPELFNKYAVNEISQTFRLRKGPGKRKNEELSQLKKLCEVQQIQGEESPILIASKEAQCLHHEWLTLHTAREPLSSRKSYLTATLKIICGEKRGIENVCSWSRSSKPNLKKSNLRDVSDELITKYIFTGEPTRKFIINPFRPYKF